MNVRNRWFRIKRRIGDIKRYVVQYHQRGKRGFADCDVWSLDNYLLSWLPDAIAQIRDYPGHPEGLSTDEWQEILDKMIIGFDCGYRLINLEFYSVDDGYLLQENVDVALDLFREHFFHLWT